MLLSGKTLTQHGLWGFGNALDAIEGRLLEGIKATGGFAKSRRELSRSLAGAFKTAPYLGHFRRGFLGFGTQALYGDFINFWCHGVSGSGKDTKVLQPMAVSLAGVSKAITCLKGDTYAILKPILEARGERVLNLNIGHMFEDQQQDSASYNPMHLLYDNFVRPGGLRDMTTDVTGFTKALNKMPKDSGEGNARFFNGGERRYMGLALQHELLTLGPDATLGGVLQLINDREALNHAALWLSGQLKKDDGSVACVNLHNSPLTQTQSAEDIDDYAEYLRGLASGAAAELGAQDTRTVDNFLAGSRQAFGTFDISTRGHLITKTSSFRFTEQKDAKAQPLTVVLTADSSRLEAQKPLMELVQFCMINEWKRHPNKQGVVYFFANEATNVETVSLPELLTFGRAINIRLAIFTQSIGSFRKMYGRDAVSTLISETDAKLFLPGIKEDEMLMLLSRVLGDKPILKRSYSNKTDRPFDSIGISVSEDAAPVRTPDQIRRMKQAILFLKDHRPAKVWLTSVASIWSIRKQMGVSPFFNKPYLLWPKLFLWKLWPYAPVNILKRSIQSFKSNVVFTRRSHA